MNTEYLLFDALILAPAVLLWAFRPRWVAGMGRPAARAIVIAAIPFIAWDAAVAGRHWWFNPDRVLAPRLFGLPLEELLFFGVVPLACLLFWELALSARTARPHPALRAVYPAALLLLLPAAWAWSTGREYTALAVGALVLAAAVDLGLGTRVLAMPRGWLQLAAVALFTTVFNGYLTARPVVLYDEQYQLPFRVGTIPLEDYGFGLSLALLSTVLYQQARARRFALSLPGWFIQRRLGGYRQLVEAPALSSPVKLATPKRVAVVGGGLAGLSAAELLSRRGFQVTVFEKNAFLGGKLSSWPEGGAEIEHGFHAFFAHYYNLLAWLGELGVADQLRPIDDYLLLHRDGGRSSFKEVETTPALNLLSLKSQGLYRWREVMKQTTGEHLLTLLKYDPVETPRTLDGVSFAQFAKAAQLPPAMKLMFTMFARAFFSDEARMSMADMVKSFHFYYLSHDRGLLYSHLQRSTREALMDPLAARLRAQGVTIHLRTPVTEVVTTAQGHTVNGEAFDALILAGEAVATRRLVQASPSLRAAVPSVGQLDGLHAGQRYAVLRVWTDAPVGGEALPVFVATERREVLDAFAFADRLGSGTSSKEVELHCYSMPEGMTDAQVQAALEAELAAFLPGFEQRTIVRRHLAVRDDFTAFHVGQHASRPAVETSLPSLFFAGDWVALPFPAMLMEAAHVSGRLAANALCRAAGVQTFPVWSVPPRGLLAPRTSLKGVTA